MKHYFAKLRPPRPNFRESITDAERRIIQDHQAYWAGYAARGWAVAYGPVADPTGDYGAGFWAVPDDVNIQDLLTDDPAIKADAGFRYEIHPMPALAIGIAFEPTD